MSKTFYPYYQWEDWLNGMYATPPPQEFENMVSLSLALLSDCSRLEVEMQRTVDTWPVSASHNLRSGECNHRAWLGQAACCIAHKCCEDATRRAWCLLNSTQQNQANAVADRVFLRYMKRFQKQLEFEFQYA